MRVVVAIMLVSVALAGCSDSEPAGLQWTEPAPTGAGCFNAREADQRAQPIVILETNHGVIEAEIYADQVPATAGAFIDWVEAGAYVGARFHYVETDYMMRVAPEGPAAPLEPAPREYHHALSHDAAGVLSMATQDGALPGEFSILSRPADWLDQSQPIFARIVSGSEVAQTVNDEAGLGSGKPRMEVVIEEASIRYPPAAEAAPGPARIGLWVPDVHQKTATTGGKAGFLAVAVNCSDHPVEVTIEGFEEGRNVLRVEPGYERIELASGQRAGFVVTGEAGLGHGEVTMPLAASTPGGKRQVVQLTIERDPEAGARDVVADKLVRAHYIGMVADGRVFGTSIEPVADGVLRADLDYTLFAESVAQGRAVAGTFAPVIFLPAEGMFEGILDLTVGVQEGGSAAARIPQEKAYQCTPAKGSDCPSHLANRPLLFQVEVVGVQP